MRAASGPKGVCAEQIVHAWSGSYMLLEVHDVFDDPKQTASSLTLWEMMLCDGPERKEEQRPLR